jgi:RNA polymerase sigma-70 factor (ECF subfamily)
MMALAASQPSETSTDASLLEQVAEGSAEALASLYDRHAGAVYSIAARTTGDATDASDVVQETFLAVWDRAELFDPARGSLRGWLFAIARNRAIDHVRHAQRHDRALTFSTLATADNDDSSIAEWLTSSGSPVAMGAPDPGPEATVVGLETRGSVAEAIAALPPVERSVITLAYGAHLSQVEIAARLGWPIGTVKTRTRRALRHLRERMAWPSMAAGEDGRGEQTGTARPQVTRRPVTTTDASVCCS